MKGSSTVKILHLIFIWFSVYSVIISLYLLNHGYLLGRTYSISIFITTFSIAIELIIIILQISFFISSFINGLRLKYEIFKRQRIEKNTFFWISDEKIGNPNELIKLLDLRNLNFYNSDLTTTQRYLYVKSYIKNTLTKEDINSWYSLLKVKKENKNILSYLIPAIFSFSAVTWFIEQIPNFYNLISNYLESAGSFIANMYFSIFMLISIASFFIFMNYLSYDSRMTNFFLIILGDIKKEFNDEQHLSS